MHTAFCVNLGFIFCCNVLWIFFAWRTVDFFFVERHIRCNTFIYGWLFLEKILIKTLAIVETEILHLSCKYSKFKFLLITLVKNE